MDSLLNRHHKLLDIYADFSFISQNLTRIQLKKNIIQLIHSPIQTLHFISKKICKFTFSNALCLCTKTTLELLLTNKKQFIPLIPTNMITLAHEKIQLHLYPQSNINTKKVNYLASYKKKGKKNTKYKISLQNMPNCQHIEHYTLAQRIDTVFTHCSCS